MPRTMLTDEQWSKLSAILLESGRVYNIGNYLHPTLLILPARAI